MIPREIETLYEGSFTITSGTCKLFNGPTQLTMSRSLSSAAANQAVVAAFSFPNLDSRISYHRVPVNNIPGNGSIIFAQMKTVHVCRRYNERSSNFADRIS